MTKQMNTLSRKTERRQKALDRLLKSPGIQNPLRNKEIHNLKVNIDNGTSEKAGTKKKKEGKRHD